MSITAYKIESVGHDRTGKDYGYVNIMYRYGNKRSCPQPDQCEKMEVMWADESVYGPPAPGSKVGDFIMTWLMGPWNCGVFTHREIAQRLQEADCFALASVSETFGVSYLEALSCGVPVIATRCGGPECFVNEHNGIMVEPDNVDDLAKAMQTMYYNISYYNRAEIARKIREDYSAQAVASRLMEQYERLARRAGSELVGSFSR